MSIKQDRPGARTPADLERKYDFGKTFRNFSEVTETQGKQIEKLNQDTGAFQTAMNTKLEEIEVDIDSLVDDINALEDKVGNYTLSDINTRLAAVENAVSSMSSLPGSLSALSETVSSLSEEAAVLTAWKTTAEEQIADLLERVTALESTE